MERHLILASASPRRHGLLADAGYAFEIDSPDVDESPLPGESADAMVLRLAHAKAAAVAPRWPANTCVLGCDTTVILDGDVLGKPIDSEDAIATLLRIAGRRHTVISAFAIVSSGERPVMETVSSDVLMTPIDRDEAAAYVATGEPMDKAGSYAIQGIGRRFVDHHDGSFSNIMGLPMESVQPALARMGIVPSGHRHRAD